MGSEMCIRDRPTSGRPITIALSTRVATQTRSYSSTGHPSEAGRLPSLSSSPCSSYYSTVGGRTEKPPQKHIPPNSMSSPPSPGMAPAVGARTRPPEQRISRKSASGLPFRAPRSSTRLPHAWGLRISLRISTGANPSPHPTATTWSGLGFPWGIGRSCRPRAGLGPPAGGWSPSLPHRYLRRRRPSAVHPPEFFPSWNVPCGLVPLCQ